MLRILKVWRRIKSQAFHMSKAFWKIQERTIDDSDREAWYEKNDCTVFAIKNAFGISYREAHQICRAAGRKNWRGMRGSDWDFLMNTFVKRKILEEITHYFPAKTVLQALNYFPPSVNGNSYTLIVDVGCHVFAVRDGKIIDGGDSVNRRIKRVWRVLSSSRI